MSKQADTLAPERDYLWDNIKGILIFLVVTGHLLHNSVLPFSESFAMWIYTFHMPAFIFISGFWAKSYCKNGVVRAEKLGVLLNYYLIFQLLWGLYRFLIGYTGAFQLFHALRGMWYLLTLVTLYLLIPLVERLPSWITVPIFIVMGLIIGLEGNAGHYFSIQRTFTFAPFFFAGYYTKASQVKELLSMKPYVRYPLGAVCAFVSIAIWNANPTTFDEEIFFGKTSYENLDLDFWQGAGERIGAYFIAFLMIVALMMFAPKVKTFLSYAGQRSLQTYIFHLPIVIMLYDTKLLSFVVVTDWLSFTLVLFSAAALVAIFSTPIFGYPFKWIQLLTHKIYSLKKEPELSEPVKHKKRK